MRLVTIVPPAPDASGHTRTHGTQVLDANGQPIKGITKIVLTAEVSDVWRAEIHCHVQVPRIEGVEATIVPVLPEARSVRGLDSDGLLARLWRWVRSLTR